MFGGFGCSLSPTPLPQVGEGLKKLSRRERAIILEDILNYAN